jgi:DNA-binding NtrC family response regulator
MKKTDFTILAVDDEIEMRRALKSLMEREGFSISSASNGREALKKYEEHRFDLIISDIMMPEMDGIELLKKLRKVNEEVLVILITGYATIESAVQAIKIGAEDYFTKPFKNEEIIKVVDRLYKNHQLKRRNEILKQEILRSDIPEIIGNTPKISKILSDIKMVADSDIPVFVTGESGTGKELVARAIHSLSSRKSEPFVPINCAAVPNELLESEFFGHEKGAFSGALSRKYGLFETADKGTLFLDEIAEMALPLQSKILRTVETMQFRRIGGTQLITVDLRFVCCTNCDIKEEVDKGRFRGDLYYRLSTFGIHLPPLRERREDIPLLVNNYLKQRGTKPIILPEKIMSALKQYDWPGNIRELEHVLERLILFSKNKTPGLKNLPGEIQESYQRQSKLHADFTPGQNRPLCEIEKEYILAVMQQCNNNKKESADILGIGLKTLYRKLDEYR